ncbi:MAG: DoxX family protein [Chloroflexi bacterium]|nr:MAG: DoxX family protein [Chloroflexota bacterium]
MDILFLIGRIIVGIFYLMNAYNHFTQVGGMSGYASSKGVPAPQIAVIGSGVLLLIGGLSILLGFYPLIGVLAIVLFYLPVSLMMHNFWTVEDPQSKQMEMIQFMKNMALMGSALMFLAIPRPWPFGLGG